MNTPFSLSLSFALSLTFHAPGNNSTAASVIKSGNNGCNVYNNSDMAEEDSEREWVSEMQAGYYKTQSNFTRITNRTMGDILALLSLPLSPFPRHTRRVRRSN